MQSGTEESGTEESGTEESGTEESGTEESNKVFGDCAYGSGEFQSILEERGIDSGCKTQPPAPRPGGLFTKDRFDIDLDRDTVTCPGGSARRSTAAVTGRAPRASARPAPTARYANGAPPPRLVAPSPSAHSRPRWPAPGPARPTRPGRPTTPRPARRSNVRSVT